jgi:hypothetical protein
LHRALWYKLTDVSDVLIASIIRANELSWHLISGSFTTSKICRHIPVLINIAQQQQRQQQRTLYMKTVLFFERK